MSYQALFATFAAVYIGISLAGMWFVGDTVRVETLVDLVNTYVPGLIGPEGAITQDQIVVVANRNIGQFGWSGVVAVIILVWTAIGWITYSRMAIRSMFGLPKDPRNYVILKSWDALAAVVFGVALLLGAVLTGASTTLLESLLSLVGFPNATTLVNISARAIGLILVFAIDALVLAAMFQFLSGTVLRWRDMRSGTLLGSAVLVGMQVLSSTLISSAGRNPLLATFVVFVGMLLWFRLTSIVTLTAAAWIAEKVRSDGSALPEIRQRAR